jgi:hypothetical protein
MTDPRIQPRSVEAEIATLDKRIEACQRAIAESANDYDRATNARSIERLTELRKGWVEQREGMRDEHIKHAWQMFTLHLQIAADHFHRWERLVGR